MKQLAEDCGDSVKLSSALQGLALSHGYIGEHNAALKYSVEAQQEAQKGNDRLDVARSLWLQGSAHYRMGEAQKTLALAEQALAIVTDLNDRSEMGRCLNMMAASFYTLGQYLKAQEQWENALAIFQELGNRRLGMDMLSNLGVIADARGDYETAFQRYHSALEIAREVGYRDGEIVFLTNRGGEQVALKNYAAAEMDLRKAIELAGIEGSWCLPNTYCYHADQPGAYGDIWLWKTGYRGFLEKNRWYCIEQHVKLNTPGEKDGILRAWVDGRPAFEKTDIRFRHVDRLKIEQIWMNVYHGGTAASPYDQHLFVDNVVIATKYIGPMKTAPAR